MKKILCACLALILCLACAGCKERVDPYEGVPNPEFVITMKNGQVMRGELFIAQAPNTVGNFIELANGGFYDGLGFYRLVAGRFIQTGDPLEDGTGGPGYAIKGEFSKNGVKNGVQHTQGTLSMARTSDYNSAGSQFFILQRAFAEYDGEYAAFGRLTDAESLVTLDAIASTATDGSYRPLLPQVIDTIRVDTHGYVFPVVKIYPPEEKEEEKEEKEGA